MTPEHAGNHPPSIETSPNTPRQAYQTPLVLDCGDVRDVTMGPTPGVGESGNSGSLRP